MSEMGRKFELVINDKNVLAGNEIHEDAKIIIKKDGKQSYITITANKEGFMSLAKIFVAFAEGDLDKNFHLHLDAPPKNYRGHLNEDSDNVVITKIE